MTAATATELAAILEVQIAKQETADKIVAALLRHIDGRAIAAQVQREREERARVDAHYGGLVARTKCADCESMFDGGCCDAHNKNAEYL